MKRQCVVVLAALALCAAASADFTTGFENYNGSAAGVVLTGQDGWTLPAGSTDFNVYTYQGNALNIPTNPQGGNQFVAGKSAGGTPTPIYARAERPHDFGAGGQWTFTYDQLGKYLGTLPAQDYLGSFSLQPSATSRYFQTLSIWNDNNNPVNYKVNYITKANAVPGISPGTEWSNLDPSHWYRLSTTINLTTNLYIAVSIEDLTAGTPATVFNPTGWVLPLDTGPLPTAFRLFAGGANGGNTLAVDNINIVPEPASLLALGLLALLVRRR